MSDKDLRDKLASDLACEFVDSLSETADYSFKAGWDSARANTPGPMAQMLTNLELEHERDKLKAERDALVDKLSLSITESVELHRQHQQLKAAAEKLAEALSAVIDGEGGDPERCEALTEYREQFSKEQK